MSLPNPNLTQRSHAALENDVLQGALKAATTTFIERRRDAITSVSDWEALRQRARQVKEHTINNLDFYLEQLVEKVQSHGGKVYWARTGDDVSRYIIELARARGAKSVVKSKSMATEEIELNHALEAADVRPVETDLGEYIIQLAHEKPSHIIVPAIHKNSTFSLRKLRSIWSGLNVVQTHRDPRSVSYSVSRLLVRGRRMRRRCSSLIACGDSKLTKKSS